MERLAFEELYIPDTSAVVEHIVSELVEKGAIRGRILIHTLLISYFESKADEGHVIGVLGLQELVRLRELADKGLTMIEIVGEERRLEALEENEVNRVVRSYAAKSGAKLVTCSEVQYLAARAMGVDALYIRPRREEELVFKNLFDEETMSVHLKEGATPKAKKGRPGAWRLVEIGSEVVTREELEKLVNQVLERAKAGEGIIEVERPGSIIVQLGDYRVVVVRPPVSDGVEVTVTKPLARPRLEDYKLPEKLMKRLEERAEGILIAGAPGMGKTTFAQALADYYRRKGRIVKTIESPRDMRLPEDVTQYSKAYAGSEELHDILLLSRPDYTVLDEMRDDEDFKLFVDLRLAGIGMIGVVHATSPIDAVQRLLRRVDLGMIPSIVDTVIFIESGRVSKVYEVLLTVKLPTGLREAELARPVVEVRDFLTGELEYEIYTFGEQTVVVPVKRVKKSMYRDKAIELVKKMLPFADIDLEDGTAIVKIPRSVFSASVSRKLRRLERRLESLGISLRVKLV